ncbi:MAG: glycosyltransferase family 2 protein [Chloroflexota bacterium]
MPEPRQLLTVIVPTGNREDVIADCLRSVRWADEVLVVDSFSTDGTLEIARQFADRILQHEYGFSALQKNWAIPQATHDWVLIVDTDERVTNPLREEILARLASPGEFAGFRIPRLNLILGKPIRQAGYFPDYQTRLFRRDRGRYALRKVHAHLILDGPCGTLGAPLVHYAHRSVDDLLNNLLVTMTTWEADQRLSERKRIALWPGLLLRPVAAFLLRYIRQGGWRDGSRGLVTSLIWAMYVSITYMKIWERQLDLPEDWWIEHWKDYDNPDPEKGT